MIKKDKVYIKDICKAPFIDRFCYILFNDIKPDLSADYMTLNPLKWSLMTVVMSAYLLFVYSIIIPILGFPCIAYDAYMMPENYESSKFNGWFQDGVWLLRELK